MSQATYALAGGIAGLEPHRRTVETAAGPLSCLDVGSGPAALFVHGIGTNAHLWRHAIAALAGERRIVAPDLPGHGRSPAGAVGLTPVAAALAAFCDAYGLDRVDLVANDTGGAVAQVFAAHHPERLRTATFTNCDTRGNMPPALFKPTVWMGKAGLIAPFAPWLAKHPRLAARFAFGQTYEDVGKIPEEVIRSFLEPVSATRERARGFERWLAALEGDDLDTVDPVLRRLDVPTRLVWGTADRFFGMKWAHRLAETIPGTTGIDEVPGGRLFFVDERADELVAHLRAHWAT